MAALHIRPFAILDTNAVVTLWQRCGLVVAWNDPVKDIERKLAVGRELFLVGEVAGQVVASAMGGYEGHRGWVNYLTVDPAWQRRGFGRAMMNAVEQRLLALGCPKINLQVRRGNTAVLQFYAALGYCEDAVISLGKRLIPDT